MRRAAAAVALLLVQACAPTGEAFPDGAPRDVAFETEHFTYYADEPVCEDIGERMEEFYAAAVDFLGIEASGAHHYRYFFYGEEADISPPCDEAYHWGCDLGEGDIVAEAWFRATR